MTLIISKLIITATMCISLSIAQSTTPSDSAKQIAQDISYGLTDLACKLSVQLQSDDSKIGIISPLSIGSSMLLLMRIASGSTRDQLLHLMQLEKHERNKSMLSNQLYGLLTELLDGIQEESILNDKPNWMKQRECEDEDYDEYVDELNDHYFDYDSEASNETVEVNYDSEASTDTVEVNTVRLANGMFIQNGLFNNSALKSELEQSYYSKVDNLDFFGAPNNATQYINNWVSINTYGRIPEIFSEELDRGTKMLVANAMYFKAFWKNKFLKDATRLGNFFPNGAEYDPVKVDMMAHNGCFPYYSSVELDANILGFPYINNTFTMYAIQPNNSSRAKLQALMSKMNARTLDNLISNMTMSDALIQFPRMVISADFNLESTLQQLGVTAMFKDRENDFSLLNPYATAGSKKVSVKQVKHHVKLRIDEDGTEGAAGTISFGYTSLPPVYFKADTPFLIAIRHDVTKLLLFYGPVYDPSN